MIFQGKGLMQTYWLIEERKKGETVPGGPAK